MFHARPALLSLVLSIAFCACTHPLQVLHADSSASDSPGPDRPNPEADGSIATGGAATGTGGASGTGGLSQSGGVGSGGVAGTGSLPSTGGVAGGADLPGTGGMTGSGGIVSTGGSIGAGGNNACPLTGEMISDFESPPGQAGMISQEHRQGYWYVYFPGSDTSTAPETGRKQTPALNNGKPIATEPAPDPNTCNQFALHSTASGFDSQYDPPVGFGAFFLPHVPWDRVADAYDAREYTGVSFKIKSGGGTPPAVFFEVVTKQTMPISAGGSASDQSLDLYTTLGQLLGSPWSPSDISATYQTVTVPFGSLVPRWLPTTNTPPYSTMGCSTGTTTAQPRCQVKPFAAQDVLGIRFSMYLDDGFPKPDGSTPGTYDLWIDDVAFVTDDAGLPARKGFPLSSPGTFGKCVLPSGPSVGAKFLVSAYNQWKARFVRNDKVIRPDNQNDTLSEGIAFGMLIALNLNDQPLFDGLYGTWKSNPAANAGTLMKSCLGSGGKSSGVACTASDGSDTGADQDAAYALVMADKLWGGTYKADAIAMLKDIWDKDIDGASSKLPKGGSSFQAPTGTKAGQITRPSYFAPSFYRVFASADPDASHDWTGVISAVYAVIKGPLVGSNGLVPGWCGSSCTVAASNGDANDIVYQYDSHRVPMRMALDYCFYENAAAKAYTDLTTHFFTGAANDGLGRILDLYTTSGGLVTRSTGNSASLLGTAAVGAMASGNSSFLDNAYQTVFDIATRGTMATPSYVSDSRYAPEPTYSYANATIGLLTLLIMTGNFMH